MVLSYDVDAINEVEEPDRERNVEGLDTEESNTEEPNAEGSAEPEQEDESEQEDELDESEQEDESDESEQEDESDESEQAGSRYQVLPSEQSKEHGEISNVKELDIENNITTLTAALSVALNPPTSTAVSEATFLWDRILTLENKIEALEAKIKTFDELPESVAVLLKNLMIHKSKSSVIIEK